MLPHSNPANYMFNLRPHGHDLSFPSVKKVLFKNSFIMRALFQGHREFPFGNSREFCSVLHLIFFYGNFEFR